jgi:3-dehydroquinate synthase
MLSNENAKSMQSLKVNLGERSYPIYVGAGILERAGEFLAQAGLRGKVAIVTNPMVAQLYLDAAHDSLSRAGFEVTPVLVPDGEEHKNLHSLGSLYDRFIAARLERKSCVFALGGGVIGDLAGLAAATYLRGIPYVQVPTTLLAQVDSSVGGKTGINHADGKNLIGAFYQPSLVVIDVTALQSLPHREFVAGLAEVIKYGIIEDPALFSMLEEGMEKIMGLHQEMLTRIIATSCAIKARIVAADEREDDYRAVLNFGHTIGHALEAATAYRQFLHGEAVGVGMVKAATLSAKQGFCDNAALKRITALVQRAGLPLEIPAGVSPQSLLEAMEIDKKVAGGKIKFVMCEGIGKSRFHWLAPDEVLRGLNA